MGAFNEVSASRRGRSGLLTSRYLLMPLLIQSDGLEILASRLSPQPFAQSVLSAAGHDLTYEGCGQSPTLRSSKRGPEPSSIARGNTVASGRVSRLGHTSFLFSYLCFRRVWYWHRADSINIRSFPYPFIPAGAQTVTMPRDRPVTESLTCCASRPA